MEAFVAESSTGGGHPSYYPIYLSLVGQTCLVAGGGPTIEPIVREALQCEARVVVASVTLTPALRTLAEAGELIWHARPAAEADVEAAFAVFAATGDAALDGRLVAAAERAGRLATRLDDQRLGNFLAPPSFRQGDLTVAITSSGLAPALDERLVTEAAGDFGPEWATFLTWLGEKRAEVKARHPSIVCRIRLWDDVVATDVLALIRAGREAAARAKYERLLGEWTPDATVPIGENCCRRCAPATA
jgi:precorrin-2 dehydrogenase/sirohydrochlorin ferrochelatase